MKIILADGTEYQIKDISSINHIFIDYSSVSEVFNIINAFSDSNLSEYQIIDDDGNVVTPVSFTLTGAYIYIKESFVEMILDQNNDLVDKANAYDILIGESE